MTNYSRKTGLADAVQVDDGSGDIFADVDVNISSASHEIEIPSNLLSSVGEGAGFVARDDGQMSVTGDISIRAITLEVLRTIGNYSEGAEQWTIESQDILPEYMFKQQVADDGVLVLSGYDDSGAEPVPETGFKFDAATFTVDTDGVVEIDLSGVGLYAEVQSGSIETNNSTLNPENYLDAHVEIDGTKVGSLDSVEFSIERNADAVRGIEQREENYRLLPTEIVEGMRDVSFSMTVEVTDETAWEKVMDDTGKPLRPSDNRSESSVKVVVSDGEEIEVTGAVFETESAELADDADVRTVDIDGNARDWVARGDL